MTIYNYLSSVMVDKMNDKDFERDMQQLVKDTRVRYKAVLKVAKLKQKRNKGIVRRNLRNLGNPGYVKMDLVELTTEEWLILKMDNWKVRLGLFILYYFT